MAFTPLTTAEVSADEPTKQELFDKIRTNFDDHESRISSNSTALQVFEPIIFSAQGVHYLIGPQNSLSFRRIVKPITITNGLVFIHIAGTAGTLRSDVLVSTDGGSTFNSLFTVTPNVAFGAGNFADNTGTLDATRVDLVTGDILRHDVVTYQVGNFSFDTILEFIAT